MQKKLIARYKETYEKGLKLYQEEKYKKAAECFLDYSVRFPSARLYKMIAECYYNINKYYDYLEYLLTAEDYLADIPIEKDPVIHHEVNYFVGLHYFDEAYGHCSDIGIVTDNFIDLCDYSLIDMKPEDVVKKARIITENFEKFIFYINKPIVFDNCSFTQEIHVNLPFYSFYFYAYDVMVNLNMHCLQNIKLAAEYLEGYQYRYSELQELVSERYKRRTGQLEEKIKLILN